MGARFTPSQLPDALLAEGRHWATTAELEGLTGQHGATLRSSLRRLINEGRLFSPARGLYVVVPPEYRSWRVIPAAWFIDAMMDHLGRDYYVGFLSAAASHGASHQAPQVYQVVTSHPPVADRDIERVRLRFTASETTREMPAEQQTTPAGYVKVATPETTMVDLAWRPKLGAGINNVATVLMEIEGLDPEQLARVAQLRPRAAARRLGWLVERFRPDLDTHWLRVVAQPDAGKPSVLAPGPPQRGPVDRRWGVRVNASVEPDV